MGEVYLKPRHFTHFLYSFYSGMYFAISSARTKTLLQEVLLGESRGIAMGIGYATPTSKLYLLSLFSFGRGMGEPFNWLYLKGLYGHFTGRNGCFVKLSEVCEL